MTAEIEFKKTRMLNWVVFTLLLIGSVLMAINVRNALGFVLIFSFALFFIAPLLLTAIALSNQSVYFFGILIDISQARKNTLITVTWYWNWLIFIWAMIGVVMCIFTEQYPVIFSMLFYVIPTVLNLVAIKQIRALKA